MADVQYDDISIMILTERVGGSVLDVGGGLKDVDVVAVVH